ncbi:hypothetical protein N9C20_05025 [Luminiphilus sp.]|nr:hypothetical protein [Luminiphilus sp.]
MTELSKRLSNPTVVLALVCCILLSLLDIGFRVLPEWADQPDSSVNRSGQLFERQKPSKRWQDWFDAGKAIEAAEAAKRAEQRAKVEAEQRALSEVKIPPIVIQEGDVEVLRVGALDYRLWGVFTSSGADGGFDTFAVLKSQDAAALQVRVGDVVDAYQVTDLSTRSVTFKSTSDDRTLMLWLFGKGPR